METKKFPGDNNANKQPVAKVRFLLDVANSRVFFFYFFLIKIYSNVVVNFQFVEFVLSPGEGGSF